MSRPSHPVLAGAPLLIAHRGGAGLAPENTLAAFALASSRWHVDMIELDVRASADGHCVVIHDATADRTTDGGGRVEAMTLEQLQSFDAGHRFSADGGKTYPFRGKGVRVPTISEVLEALPDMRFTIELKTADAQKPLFEAIARAGATGRVVVAAERRAYRSQFGAYKGCISASREDAMPFLLLHKFRLAFLGHVKAHVWQTCEALNGRRILSARLVRELHAKGLDVHVWTVNDTQDMERLLDWEVDGIVTDRPDRLAKVLHQRVGRPLPPGLPTA